MRRLEHACELLDGDLSDTRALAGNLRDLRRINRRLGGVSLSRHALDALVAASGLEGSPIRLLDVGTGAADIPLALLEDAQRRGRQLSITAIDSRPEVLAAAEAIEPNLDTVRGLTMAVADGRRLPYGDGAFDIAHASLVLHHQEPDAALHLIGEMARVARHGVVLNDLARGWLPWLGSWLVLHLSTANRYTRHDGPLSVRRAYTVSEAADLLAQVGLRVVHRERGFAGHRFALAAAPS